ncbi:plastocyanin/azurin family copper-binding protein [Sphingomonas sp.]|uniref:plastocyanin/azurin family copper-binding protein n=1 Tax=Sphingomonas sp. TaxID=28214 RepID=UPI001B011644|nr:plastocyanin/azurin family copper-binding protein [Sphingomonas sp.]MBO9714678.1 copper-binding protein [Sphingomonas sp.]
MTPFRFAAPLLALLAVPAAEARQQPAPQRVDVAMSNFKFSPTTIRMKPGAAYVLHLTSSGSHSFEAKAFFAAAKVAPADRAKIAGGKVEVDSDAPVDIHFIAPAAGTYPVRCTHFLHASFGMTGQIVVG